MQATSDAGTPDDGGTNASSAGDGGSAASSGGGDAAILDGPANAVGSSSGGAALGPPGGEASSANGDASIVLADESGVGLPHTSANDNNASSWNPYAPAGCGCTVVDGESRYGTMAALGAVLAAWAMRRKRHSG